MLYAWFGVIAATALCAGFWRSRAFLMVSALVLVAGIGLSLAWVPAIKASATQIAAGRAWCLALPAQHRPVQSTFDLTLFIAKGNRLTPHLMLWVENGQTPEPYTWSYSKSEFVQHLPRGVIRNCSPSPDFLTDLPSTGDGLHLGIGRDTYLIPEARHPSHQDDDYFSIKIVPSETLPVRSARIETGRDAISRWRNRNMTEPASGPQTGSTRREKAAGFPALTFDPDGQLVQRFGCLNANHCRLEFVRDDLLFDLQLMPIGPERIPDVKLAFEALWSSFRQ